MYCTVLYCRVYKHINILFNVYDVQKANMQSVFIFLKLFLDLK